MKNKARFWNWTANRYSKSPIANEEAYQKKLEKTQEYFMQDFKLFEFGCGTGSTAIHHAPKVHSILAIDISSKMIEIAKRKAEGNQIWNIDFRCTSIEGMQLDEEAFDMALAMSILHLLEDKEMVLRSIHRMLKPGGIFVSSTACVQDMMPAARYLLPLGSFLGVLPLVRFFTEAELIESIEDAGFKIEHQWRPSKKEATFIIARKM